MKKNVTETRHISYRIETAKVSIREGNDNKIIIDQNTLNSANRSIAFDNITQLDRFSKDLREVVEDLKEEMNEK